MKKFILDNDIYLLSENKVIWSFHYQYPDIIGLGESYIGAENKKKLNKIATECDPKLFKELCFYIEKSGCGIKGNYLKMIDILSHLFETSEEDIKDKLKYNETAKKVTNKLKNKNGDRDYYECLSLLKKWDWDEDRVLKYWESPLSNKKWDGAMVDIFPTKEDLARPTWPTESFLLHKFHNSWSEDLDKLIAEAVEKYPDPKDYDYAGYYVMEKLKKKNYDER